MIGFEKPQLGKINFDKRDIDELDKRELRKKFGVVLQNGGLITGSIYENITITSPGVTVERVEETLREVGLEDDIKAMPMGLHTVIAEGAGTISPAVMSGYYNDEEATKAFFFTDEDGNVWGRTGDAGRVDDDGFVYVYGRRDSAFCPDGVHAVYPSEIENVLAEDARVLGCAVVLDKESGAVTAHIHASVSDENEQDALTGSLRELALKRLPEKSRPAGYVYWPEGLPINECGKTDRRKLENC